MPLLSRRDDKNEAASLFQERENQDLIANIALLQDEVRFFQICLQMRASLRCPDTLLMASQNFKVSLEMDELQKRIAELCDINADLQVSTIFLFLYIFLRSMLLCIHTPIYLLLFLKKIV